MTPLASIARHAFAHAEHADGVCEDPVGQPATGRVLVQVKVQ